MKVIDKVAAVVLRGGLLLVVRKRGSSVFLSPGGKPEAGETPPQTLARELAEETGLRVRSAREMGSYSGASALESETTVRITVFVVDADGAAAPGAEIEELAWIDAGYREDGLALGSVFELDVVPALVAEGLLRQRRTTPVEPRVLVADLDGTLSFDGRSIGPEVSSALRDLGTRAGLRLVFATSRAPRGARALLGPLADGADLICCNGAVTVVDGVMRRTRTLPDPLVEDVVEFLRSRQTPFYLDRGDRFFVYGGGFPWMDYADRLDVASSETPVVGEVVKIAIDTPDPDRLLSDLRSHAGPEVEICAHEGGVLDLTPAGLSKATAITELGIHELVAYGNDLNDQDMLGRADLSVVVGHGLPGIDRAGHVERVAPDDASVAAALRSLAHTVDRVRVR